jgi:hypothetical protein
MTNGDGGVLLDILKLLNSALRQIDDLPDYERNLPRVVGIRNALWIQKANVLGSAGQFGKAIGLARRAAESDAALYGDSHEEYADDLLVLAQLLEASAEVDGRSCDEEATKWFEVALAIYERPGPHMNLLRANAIRESLAMLND